MREERLHELAARQNSKRQNSIKSVMKKWALTALPFALSPFLHAWPNPLKQAIVCAIIYIEILYLIFDYPHKHYTFKYFEV